MKILLLKNKILIKIFLWECILEGPKAIDKSAEWF